ncbi:MAG: YhcH/YjgK/YiaL family protein, partial [Clostridia bacterium]|nr:YhcH/YjgK/YiaL family protein [Clostridia bacterium]
MTVTHLNKIIPEGLSSLHPLFGQAFEEMSRLCRENAPDGHYEIEGDKLFINVMTYSTKPESDSLFETHRDYVDIQMMMEGK